MDEEEGLVWQETLDEIAAGRTKGLRCPFCQKGEVSIEKKELVTRVECRICKRFIEGRMAPA